MLVANMTDTEKRRLKANYLCPICGQKIEYFQDAQILKIRNGRYLQYHFFHTSCLNISPVEKGEENGEIEN